MRQPRGGDAADFLVMDGPEIFAFTIAAVPAMVRQLLAVAGIAPEDVDLFVFHQANRYMLEHLRNTLDIPPEKFPVCLQDCGNTVSSTIPITLDRAREAGRTPAGPDRHAGLLRRRILVGGRDGPMDGPRGGRPLPAPRRWRMSRLHGGAIMIGDSIRLGSRSLIMPGGTIRDGGVVSDMYDGLRIVEDAAPPVNPA